MLTNQGMESGGCGCWICSFGMALLRALLIHKRALLLQHVKWLWKWFRGWRWAAVAVGLEIYQGVSQI